MRLGRLLATFVLFTAPMLAEAAPPPPPEASLHHCLVSLEADIKVPAEAAGVLVAVERHEGDQVEAGQLLAKVDDRQAQCQMRVAEADVKVSKEKAENDVNFRYAMAAQRVAEKELELNMRAVERVPGSKSQVEIQKLALTVEQAKLQGEQAQHEQQIAALETEGFVAKVDLSQDEIRRRQIKSPINGEVVEVMMRPGEWAEPGDTLFRVVRLDKLRVEGFLNVSEFSPSEVNNRPVRVTVTLARGRTETFAGKIVFVNPIVQAGGEYLVRAEVANRVEGGLWLLRPGLEVDMAIDTGVLASRPAAETR